MINTILIVLVAVVVLIVIIAVLALHFLRADDSDTFDEIPDEPRRSRRTPADPPPAPRELVPAAAERGRPRRSEAAREPWVAERPVRADDDRTSSYRERDTGPRPAVPDRRDAQPGKKRPAAASARPAKPGKPAKPARPANQDPKSSSWDSLSDVDYWAELAVDKPQITPAAAASGPAVPAGAAGRSPEGKPGGRSAARPALRDDIGQLPRRQRAQSARGAATTPPGRPVEAGQTGPLDVRAARASGSYGNEPATQSLAALARLGGQPPAPSPRPAAAQRPATGPRPASGPRPATAPRPAGSQRPATGPRPAQPALPGSPGAHVSHSNGRTRPPVPLDDDPLTSPSFPAVNASDSRSYRTRRPSAGHGGPPTGPHTGPQSVGGRGNGSYGEPAAQFTQYPPAPQGHSQPMMQSPAPVANPYGSYVSAPQPTYQDVPAAQPDASAYGNDYSGNWQADGSWYAGAANNGAGNDDAATGYLPAPAYNGIDHAGNGYPPADYGVSYQGAAYQAGPTTTGAPGSYAPQGNFGPQYDQRGYGSPDLPYGPDGYQAHPGYGPGGR